MSTVTQNTPILKELQTENTHQTPDTPPGTPDKSTDIPGVVKNSYKGYALSIWEYLTHKVGEQGELIQTELAAYLGCSRRTVQRTLNYFEDWELIEIESYNGPGNGIKIRNRWLQRDRERKRKVAWKVAYEKEAEYLRTTYTPGGHARCDTKEYIRNIGKTITKERDQSSAFYINNSNLTKNERRKRWLTKQNGGNKTSLKEGYQKVIMWDLRKYLEKQGLDPEAIKATCDTYWQSVKDKTLNTAREVLKELKSKAIHLFDELIETVEDYYRIANKFIYFDLLVEENDTSKQSKRSNRPGKPTPEQRRTTPENYAEDKAKAKNTRQKGFTKIIGEIFDSSSFELGNKSKPRKQSSDLLKKIRDIYDNYGEKGLKSWCEAHRISYAAAKEKLDVSTS